VPSGEKVELGEWPTIVKPFCKSKKQYQKLLDEHMEVSLLQQLHYAYNRDALLLIFRLCTTICNRYAFYAAFWKATNSVLVAAKRCALSSR